MSFSKMGKRLKEGDKTFLTHKAFFDNFPDHHDVLIVENVSEYDPEIVARHLGDSWNIHPVVVDPRCFGVAASRTRVYVLCWRKSAVQWTLDGVSLEDILDCFTAKPIGRALDWWWMDLPKSKLTEAQESWNESEHKNLSFRGTQPSGL